jgi:hypothetical protein
MTSETLTVWITFATIAGLVIAIVADVFRGDRGDDYEPVETRDEGEDA